MSDNSNDTPPKTTHPELFNARPLVISPHLAMLIGLNEAIVLQQIKYWIGKNMEDQEKYTTHFKDGRWWTFNKISAWEKQFPFWSYNTVKRTISSLENLGILVSGNYNKDKFGNPDPRNRTKWYAINYEAIPMQKTKVKNAKAQNESLGKMGDTENDYGKYPLEVSNDAICQFGTLQEPNLSPCYTEIIINKINNNNLSNASYATRSLEGEKSAEPERMTKGWRVEALYKQAKMKSGFNESLMEELHKKFVTHHINKRTERIIWDEDYLGWFEKAKLYKDRNDAKEAKTETKDKGRPKKKDFSVQRHLERVEAEKKRKEEEEARERQKEEEAERKWQEELAAMPPEERFKTEVRGRLFHDGKFSSAVHCTNDAIRVRDLDTDSLTVELITKDLSPTERVSLRRDVEAAVRALKSNFKEVVLA